MRAMRQAAHQFWFCTSSTKHDHDDDKKRRGPDKRSALSACLSLSLCVLAVIGLVVYLVRGQQVGGSLGGVGKALPRLRKFSPTAKPTPKEKWHPNLDRIQPATWKLSPNYHKPVAELDPSAMGRPPLPRYPGFRGGFKLRINVFTYNRVDSLKRLFRSLNKADFQGRNVDLHFFLDVNTGGIADKETKQFLLSSPWVHGEKVLHIRHIHGGLVAAVIESWYPSYTNEYALFCEDDIELSPLWFEFVKRSIIAYREGASADTDPRIVGLSLYTNKVVETVWPHVTNSPYELYGEMGSYTPFLYQLPSSWGAVYFPEHWRIFRDYASVRRSVDNIYLEDSYTNGWVKSWVVMYHELMYFKGWYMMYPRFPEEASLSTNHVEAGVHVSAEDSEHSKEKFTVPLLEDSTMLDSILPPPTSWSVASVGFRHQHTAKVEDMKVVDMFGEITTRKFLDEKAASLLQHDWIQCKCKERCIEDISNVIFGSQHTQLRTREHNHFTCV